MLHVQMEDRSELVHKYDDTFNYPSSQPLSERNASLRSTSPNNADKFYINDVGMDSFLSGDYSQRSDRVVRSHDESISSSKPRKPHVQVPSILDIGNAASETTSGIGNAAKPISYESLSKEECEKYKVLE